MSSYFNQIPILDIRYRMASPTPPPSVPASSKPSSPLSPSAHHIKAAENLLRENKLICQRLFSYDQDDKPQDKHTLEAARQRKHIQLTHSPYAPRKRARYNPAVSLESNEQSTISSPSKQLTETNQPSEQQQQQQQKQHQQPLDLVSRSKAIAQEDDKSLAVPHLKWKPYRIISGHLGWVRSIEFDPSNAWFATGSSDRTIKVWDSASGKLKLTLTGHIAAPRSLSISSKYPYLFSVSEDKTVKCWDLEQNKVIRNYHGHLSGVYTCALHPTLDILFTGGRDSTIRVWDIRTRKQIHVFSGHRDTINDLFSLPIDPQVVSSSIDSTIRLWDLRNLKCQSILTNHKKGVRAIVKHPREFSFTSASIDSIKSWALPDGIFMRDFKAKVDNRVEKAHGGKLVNALAVNEDNVVVSGGDDGILRFWDYKSASMFDEMKSTVQPGSLECEASIQCLSFDKSGSRLVTGETDKTIRMYREV